jgi:hypothetical protein
MKEGLMRSKIWIATLGVAGLAAVGAVVLHLQDEQRVARAELARLRTLVEVKPTDGGLMAGAGEGGAAVAELARRTARQEVRRAIAEQVADRSGDAADESNSAGDAVPAAPDVEESRDRVLSAFTDEPVDRNWGPTSSGELDRMVRAALPAGSRLTAVECRSTMCRLKLVHADPEAQPQFLRKAFRDWSGSIFVAEERRDAGGLTVALIAARPGREPPIAPR